MIIKANYIKVYSKTKSCLICCSNKPLFLIDWLISSNVDKYATVKLVQYTIRNTQLRIISYFVWLSGKKSQKYSPSK